MDEGHFMTFRLSIKEQMNKYLIYLYWHNHRVF